MRSVSSVLSCPLTIKVGLIWTGVIHFAAVQDCSTEHDLRYELAPGSNQKCRGLALCTLRSHCLVYFHPRCYDNFSDISLWSRCARGTTMVLTLCTSGCRAPRAGAPLPPQSMGARGSRGGKDLVLLPICQHQQCPCGSFLNCTIT